jgi:hypothetical protein
MPKIDAKVVADLQQHFASHPDSLASDAQKFLFDHGRSFDCKYDQNLLKATQKYCFLNCMSVAKLSNGELLYCEGFAFEPFSKKAHHHAWCITCDGNAVDFTWNPPGGGYFGIIFPAAFIGSWESEHDDQMGLLRLQNLKQYLDWLAENPPPKK